MDFLVHSKLLLIFIKILFNSSYKLERQRRAGQIKGVSGSSVEMPNNKSRSIFHIPWLFQWHQAKPLCYWDLNEQEPVFTVI